MVKTRSKDEEADTVKRPIFEIVSAPKIKSYEVDDLQEWWLKRQRYEKDMKENRNEMKKALKNFSSVCFKRSRKMLQMTILSRKLNL